MPAKFRIPLKRSPKSDPQQYRVYRLENEAIGSRRYIDLTRAAIKRFARAICRAYGVPQAKIIFTADLGRWGGEWQTGGIIKINPSKGGAMDLITIAHELAHHIHECAVPDNDHQDHGPEFVACYMSILDTARIIPIVGMRAILDRYKIKYVDPGEGRNITTLQRRISRKVA